MVRYQLASDLHIEYLENVSAKDLIKKYADVLVLGGDIGSIYKMSQLEKFLNELHEFEKIIYIPGNHEFYMVKGIEPKPFNQLLKELYDLENRIENLVILNCDTYVVDDTQFIGCTLWSDLGENFFPRFRVRIYGFNNIVYQQQYKKNLQFLQKKLKHKSEYKNVVVTHYPPIDLTKHMSNNKNNFKYLYSNNLEHMIQRNRILVWNFGHIHVNHMLSIKNVLLVTNQKGRKKDNVKDYVNDFIITV